MPARRQAWSAWNYIDRAPSPSGSLDSLLPTKIPSKRTSLTFHMNDLLNLPQSEPILTTLNPAYPPSSATLQAMIPYTHPVFDSQTLVQQEKMSSVQGKCNIWYAGAWIPRGWFYVGLEGCKGHRPEAGLTV
jgi:predicted NAD/FAD-binding protein